MVLDEQTLSFRRPDKDVAGLAIIVTHVGDKNLYSFVHYVTLNIKHSKFCQHVDKISPVPGLLRISLNIEPI
jgi:hypothetical protein